jgi:hypothetical protein
MAGRLLVLYNNKSLTFVMDSFGRQIRATGITWRLISQLNSNVPSTTSIIVFSLFSLFSLFLFHLYVFFYWEEEELLRVILLALPSDSFGITPPPFATKFLPRDLAPPHLFSAVLYRQLGKGRKGEFSFSSV